MKSEDKITFKSVFLSGIHLLLHSLLIHNWEYWDKTIEVTIPERGIGNHDLPEHTLKLTIRHRTCKFCGEIQHLPQMPSTNGFNPNRWSYGEVNELKVSGSINVL